MSLERDEKLIFNQALSRVEKTNMRLLQAFKDARDTAQAQLLKFNASVIKDGVIQPFKQARLKKLLHEINQNIDELSRVAGAVVYDGYKTVFTETYYTQAFAFEKAVNLETDIASDYLLNVPPIDQRIIKQAFNDQIGDYIFRDRHIQIKNRMKFLVQDAVGQTMIAGESVQSLARLLKGINSAFSSGLGNTTRIARTEMLKAYSLGQDEVRQEAEASGVEFEYYWDAALDGRTRPDHARADGQKAKIVNGSPVFTVGGIKFSSPRVPVNPTGSKQEAAEVINCRCRRINAPFNIRPTQRAARLKNGEWAQVNGNMSAVDWIKKEYGVDFSA